MSKRLGKTGISLYIRSFLESQLKSLKALYKLYKYNYIKYIVQFLRHSKCSVNNVYSCFIIISLGLQLF